MMISLSFISELLSSPLGILELIAMILGIVSVWLATKNNIAVFPLGMISTGLYIYIYFDSQVYAFALLNIYFTIMSLVGWYNWSLSEGEKSTYPIAWCSSKERLLTLAIFVVGLIPCLIILSNTDDIMPISDGVSAGLQVLGMWWMTRRKIDNWIAYIVANTIAIPLCLQAELYFTTFQYIVFLALAIKGLIDWIKMEKVNSREVLPN